MKSKLFYLSILMLLFYGCQTSIREESIQPRTEEIVSLLENLEGARAIQTNDQNSKKWTLWIWTPYSVVSISSKYGEKLRVVGNYFPGQKNEETQNGTKDLVQLYITRIANEFKVFSPQYYFNESFMVQNGDTVHPDGNIHKFEIDLPFYVPNPYYKDNKPN